MTATNTAIAPCKGHSPEAPLAKVAVEAKERLFGPTISVAIDRLRPDESQPRRSFPEEEMQQLARTIDIHGILQPILTSPEQDHMFAIAAGERRWRAANLACLTHVPIRPALRPLSQVEKLQLSLVENNARDPLQTLELAESLRQLEILSSPCSQAELAAAVGMKVTMVSRLLAMLRLPESVRARIDVELSPAIAIELTKLKDDRDKLDLADMASNEKMTRDQVAAMVTRRNAIVARRNENAPAEGPAKAKPVHRIALYDEFSQLDVVVTGPDGRDLSFETVVSVLDTFGRQGKKLFQGAGQLADFAQRFKKPAGAKRPLPKIPNPPAAE